MPRGRLAIVVPLLAAVACGSQPAPQPQARAEARAEAPPPSTASSGSDLPPLPSVSFAPARPMAVVETVFRFAAEHPEVLSHIPCFCGCESRGHRHNDDCFVASRDERGRVTAWEPHGIG